MFFNRVPFKIVNILGDIGSGSISELSRMLETSYAHAVKVLRVLEDNGIVKTEMRGRTRVVRLTDRGEKLYETIKKIEEILSPEFYLKKKIRRIEEEIERLHHSGRFGVPELIPLKYEIERPDLKDHIENSTREKFVAMWERALNEQM